MKLLLITLRIVMKVMSLDNLSSCYKVEEFCLCPTFSRLFLSIFLRTYVEFINYFIYL